jgi:hypothetical protein
MSDPGQSDRPDRTAAPATIQAATGTSEHTNVCANSPNIDIAHGGVIELAGDRLALTFVRLGLSGCWVGLQVGQQREDADNSDGYKQGF